MSKDGDLRGRLFYLSGFSGLTVLYLSGLTEVSGWSWRAAFTVIAAVMASLAWTEYRNIIEAFEQQAGSDSDSSSGREVIQVEVDESL